MSHISAIAGILSSRAGGSASGLPLTQGQGLSLFLSKQFSADIRLATPGSGTSRILIGKQGSVPTAVPTTGVAYTGNLSFGDGDDLGDSCFVIAVGDLDQWEVTNLLADTSYFFVSYEFNTSNLNYLTSIGTNLVEARTAVVFDETFTEGSEPPGLTYLKNTAYGYWDLSQLTFADEATITGTTDAGLQDQTSNNNDLVPGNSPVCNEITFNGVARKGARFTSSNEFLACGTQLAALQNANGFEVDMAVQVEDGRIASGEQRLCGISEGSCRFRVYIQTTGHIAILYSVDNSNIITWGTTNEGDKLADGTNTELRIRVRLDFSADAFSVWVNGSQRTGSVSVGDISLVDPTTWSTTQAFSIGNSYPNTSQAGNLTITRFAITPLKTSQQAADVDGIMAFTSTGTSGLVDYTINTPGSTVTVTNNELVIEGDPGGWLNSVIRDQIIPANLPEVEVEAIIRIHAAPDTTSFGIGVGLRNKLDTEANRSAVAEINTDTDNPFSFNKTQLYLGNGTINESAIVLTSNSSTTLNFVDGSRLKVSLKREHVGNDAFYTARVVDLINTGPAGEPLEITTSGTEPNRPSSAFFGSTMQSWIHINGGSFTIESFAIRRVGDDVVIPPNPDVADIYVTATGSDSTGDGSESNPYRTNVKGLEAIAALGGANGSKKLSTGPGVYIEASFLQIPLNLGEWFGAGAGVTTITGATNLYAPSSFNESTAIIYGNSTSPQTVNLTIRDMTIEGASRQIRNGIYFRNRNNITLKNLAVKNFNFSGIWFKRASGILIDNVDLFEAGQSGEAGNFSSGQINIYYIDGLEIKNCLFSAPTRGTGTAMESFGAEAGVDGFIENVNIHDCVVDLHPQSNYVDGSGNFVQNYSFEFWGTGCRNLEIHDNFIDQGISFGQRFTNAENTGNKIYNNIMLIEQITATGRNAIEAELSNLEIYGNYVTGVKTFVYTFNSAVHHSDGRFANWNVHHNYVELSRASFDVGFVMSNVIPVDNVTIANNTVVYTTTSGSAISLFRYSSSSQSTGGLLIENNAIYGAMPVNTNMLTVFGGGGIDSGIARNNKATHMNTLQTIANLTGGSGQNNETGLNGSGWFNFSGAKPIPYYATPASSYLRNKGFGGDDVGAYQSTS